LKMAEKTVLPARLKKSVRKKLNMAETRWNVREGLMKTRGESSRGA
jgi:hypothetical protein